MTDILFFVFIWWLPAFISLNIAYYIIEDKEYPPRWFAYLFAPFIACMGWFIVAALAVIAVAFTAIGIVERLEKSKWWNTPIK